MICNLLMYLLRTQFASKPLTIQSVHAKLGTSFENTKTKSLRTQFKSIVAVQRTFELTAPDPNDTHQFSSYLNNLDLFNWSKDQRSNRIGLASKTQFDGKLATLTIKGIEESFWLFLTLMYLLMFVLLIACTFVRPLRTPSSTPSVQLGFYYYLFALPMLRRKAFWSLVPMRLVNPWFSHIHTKKEKQSQLEAYRGTRPDWANGCPWFSRSGQTRPRAVHCSRFTRPFIIYCGVCCNRSIKVYRLDTLF